MIITFSGHREITDEIIVENKITNTLLSILKKNPESVFYCGAYGAFDELCAHVIGKLKSVYPDIKMFAVSPYAESKRFSAMKNYYDDIIFPNTAFGQPKVAIIKRNNWMVDNSDIVITYVNHLSGGAARTYLYAKQKNKKIINLGNIKNERIV